MNLTEIHLNIKASTLPYVFSRPRFGAFHLNPHDVILNNKIMPLMHKLHIQLGQIER